MAIPFLALWVPNLLDLRRYRAAQTRLLVMAGLLVIATPSFSRNLRYFDHDNAFQTRVMSAAERLLAPGEGGGEHATEPLPDKQEPDW